MKNNLKPPREVIEGLPDWFNQTNLITWLDLKSGLNSNWGQTYLVLNPEMLICMWRNSFNESWKYFQVQPASLSEVELRNFEETIKFKDLKGNPYSVQIYNLEKEYFLAFTKKLREIIADLPSPSAVIPDAKEETPELSANFPRAKSTDSLSDSSPANPEPDLDQLIAILEKRDSQNYSGDKTGFTMKFSTISMKLN